MSRRVVFFLFDAMIRLWLLSKSCCHVNLGTFHASILACLSLGKLPKSLIQGLIDRVRSMLPGWKAELMNRVGRTVHVQVVMTARIIYTAMAIEFLAWAFKTIEKLQKGFLWKGRKAINGGLLPLGLAKGSSPQRPWWPGNSRCWAALFSP
jgi:hypothetical protein